MCHVYESRTCGGKSCCRSDRETRYRERDRDIARELGLGRSCRIGKESDAHDRETTHEPQKSFDAGSREKHPDAVSESPPLGTGRCIVMYVDSKFNTDSDRIALKNAATRHAKERKRRCVFWDGSKLEHAEPLAVHTGMDILQAIYKTGCRVGKIAEIYIFSHGYDGGIVGDGGETGITQLSRQRLPNGKEVSVSDIKSLKDVLTKNVSIVLHACSLSKPPPKTIYKPLDVESDIRVAARIKKTGEKLAGIGCCYGRLSCVHVMKESADGGSDGTKRSERISLWGKLQYRACLQTESGKIYEITGAYRLKDSVRAKQKTLKLTCKNFRTLTPEAEDQKLSYSYVKSEKAQVADLSFDMEIALKFEPLPSFSESLYQALSEHHPDAAVYGHLGVARVCLESGWMKHDKDNPGGEAAKMPDELRKGCLRKE